MKTIEEIEQLFITACDKAIAEGWKIEAGGFIDLSSKSCCPITAFGECKTSISWMDHAMEFTGASYKQLENFYCAFDENGDGDPNDPFYTLGQKLRARYITK